MKISAVALSTIFCIAMTSINAMELGKAGCGDTNVVQMEQDVSKGPNFCHGLDCPAFKVVDKTEDYELREYEPSQWVNTDSSLMGYDQANAVMSTRLVQYIEGWNDKRQWVGVTTPVVTMITPGQAPTSTSNFTMSFYISPKVKDPPAPVDAHVYLSSVPTQRVFVSSFGGIEMQKDWIAQADKLAAKLESDGRKFDSSAFYTAGYDSPFRLFFRHNEIWFVTQE